MLVSKVSKSPTTRAQLEAISNTLSSKILRMKARWSDEKQVQAQANIKLCIQRSTAGKAVVILDHLTFKSSDPQPHAFKINLSAQH